MPRIPTFQNDKDLPGTTGAVFQNPSAAALPFEALERGTERIGNVALRAGIYASEMERIDRRAAQAVKALQLENALKNDIDAGAESYAQRSDFENFEKDADSLIRDLRTKYRPMLTDDRGSEDRELALAFERTFQGQTAALMRVVRDKKRDVITKQGQGEYERLFTDSLNSYGEASPEERPLIRKKLELTGLALADRRIIDPKEAESRLRDFDEKSAAKIRDVEEGQLTQLIRYDPQTALDAINENRFQNIKPDRMETMRGQAETRIDTLARKEEADIKKSIEDNQRQIKGVLQGQIWGGQGAEALMNAHYLRDNGFLDFNDVDWARKENDAYLASLKKEEKTENEEVKSRLALGLYGMRLSVSETDLQKARDRGEISPETYRTYLAHRTTRIEGDRKEAKSEAEKRQARSFEHSEKSLGLFFTLEGPGAAVIDREAKQLHANALQELYSLVYSDKMPADEALDRVKTQYGRALETVQSSNVQKMRQALPVPNAQTATVDEMALWLEDNKAKIPRATYLQTGRMIRDLEGLENLQLSQKKETEAKKEKKGKK